MAKTNNRFVYENRDIGEWLLQLVGEDAMSRKAASKVISNRFLMPVELITEQKLSSEAIFEQFRTAIREAVNSPGFPAEVFVRKLLFTSIALQKDWCRKGREERKREEAADQRELAKLGKRPTAAQRRLYIQRTWARSSRNLKRLSSQEPHELITTGITIIHVIESLGAELLPATDLLRQMREGGDQVHIASDAIARMGRAGLEFLPDLVEDLKQDDPNYYAERTLGALLRSAPEEIAAVLDLACGKVARVRINAVATLGYCGREGTSAFPEVETRLRARLENSPAETEWCGLASALGKVACTKKTIVLFLQMLRLKDPDKVGTVIVALGNAALQPRLVVPALIEMLDTFEEFNPDWDYYGEHGRITDALTKFGAAAAPAVPALVRHIWRKPYSESSTPEGSPSLESLDEGVIKLLGELGKSANASLPTLIEARRIIHSGKAEAAEASQRSEDFLDLAIKKINENG
jgi:hypothetical protein